jgi:Zn-dependent metalloprotease
MVARARLSSSCIVAIVMCWSAVPLAQQRPAAQPRLAPDFDIRDRRLMTAESSRTAQAIRDLRAQHPNVVARYDGRKGIHTFHAPVSGLTGPDRRTPSDVAQTFLSSADSALLDLEPEDVQTLRLRESQNDDPADARLVYFDQSVDGVPVFDAVVALHLGPDGRIVRLVSSAASSRDRLQGGIVGPEEAVRLAAGNVRAELDNFHPVVIQRDNGPEHRTRMDHGPLVCDPVASLVYFPMDGQLRSAWHVSVQPEGVPRAYDIVVDARTGRILLRRNSYRPPAAPLRRAIATS